MSGMTSGASVVVSLETASVAAAASGERSEKESVIVLVTKLAFAIALRQLGLPYRGCPLCC